jgi:site-specific recombinase XerD
MDYIALDNTLDGSTGENRHPEKPFIPVHDDMAAINAWLSRIEKDSHTFKAYKREAERLLLWAIAQQNKPLSSLNSLDMIEYRQFLSDPQPRERWVANYHGAPRISQNWRPFTAPLCIKSIRHADTILSSFFNFLVNQRYLQNNPLSSLPRITDSRARMTMDVDRSFNQSEWQFLIEYLTFRSGHNLKWRRNYFLVLCLYSTGLRIHEIANAKLSDIKQLDRTENQTWLKVLGKGKKLREVPLSEDLMKALAQLQLEARNISRTQFFQSDAPLIPSMSHEGNLSTRAIHKILKEIFEFVSYEMDGDQVRIKKFLKASAHWLRHTHGSHAVEKGISLTIVRDNLGHSSLATTSNYVHTDADTRYKEIVTQL